MAIDLRSLTKQAAKPIPDTVGAPAQERLADPTGKVVGEPSKEATAPKKHNVTKQKQGVTYFYSRKPDLGLFVDSNTRVKFNGNYFETSNPTVAEYLKSHYSKIVVEITEEQKEDMTTLGNDTQ